MLAVALGLSLSVAQAQTPAPALAQQGKEALAAGDWDRGCPLVEQAWTQDPELLEAGFSLAECHERRTKLASAYELFATIATKAKARGGDRAAEAQARADALAARVSTVTIEVPPGEVLGLELDGVALTPKDVGAPLKKNGGASTLVVRKEGHVDATIVIAVPSENGRRVVRAAPGPKRADAPPEPSTKEDEPPPRARVHPLRLGGAITTLAGGVALSTGVAFGVLAVLRRDESNEPGMCDAVTNVCATQEAVDLRNRSVLYGDVSTAMIVVGAAAASAGIVMLFVPLAEDEPVRAAIGPLHVGIMGDF